MNRESIKKEIHIIYEEYQNVQNGKKLRAALAAVMKLFENFLDEYNLKCKLVESMSKDKKTLSLQIEKSHLEIERLKSQIKDLQGAKSLDDKIAENYIKLNTNSKMKALPSTEDTDYESDDDDQDFLEEKEVDISQFKNYRFDEKTGDVYDKNNKKVLQKDLAKLLGISTAMYTVLKKQNKLVDKFKEYFRLAEAKVQFDTSQKQK